MTTEQVRPEVFEHANHICVCCRRRRAESMHETKPRSVGGVVSTENSIAVCGSGTTGCHGLLQQKRIVICTDAQGRRVFVPRSDTARRHMAGEITWV